LALAYVGAVFRTVEPKIGLLNIGSEPNKGNRIVRRAHALFRHHLPGFIGNVEGFDIFSGKCDIVVCDGFIGNILIKLSEGLGRQVIRLVRSRTEKTFRRKGAAEGDSPLRSEQSFTREMKRMTDSEKFGGIPLLGVRGVVLVGHGQARSRAVYNAIRAALALHANNLPERMQEAFPSPST
jgi:glycerol-3-phosphate acyltransferase PlsX